MFNNIGRKIKTLAKIVFVIEVVAIEIFGLILFFIGLDEDELFVLLAVAMMLLGPILAWLGTFVLYGFGEIIDKLSQIEENTSKKETNYPNVRNEQDERRKKLDELRSKGLITEEEYHFAVSRD